MHQIILKKGASLNGYFVQLYTVVIHFLILFLQQKTCTWNVVVFIIIIYYYHYQYQYQYQYHYHYYYFDVS